MVARNEADIIETTVRHLLAHVDEVIVADHLSTDGTLEILEGLPVAVRHATTRGFWQAEVMTGLAMEALDRGHGWVVACDADELWYPPEAGTLGDHLASLDGDVSVVRAAVYNHVPTATDDPGEPCPVRRLEWRERHRNSFKVAARLTPGVTVEQGNHHATHADMRELVVYGLTVRHFTARSEQQFLRKVRVGADSYSVEAGMPAGHDGGWARWRAMTDDEVVGWFRSELLVADPEKDATLVRDPAPLVRRRRYRHAP